MTTITHEQPVTAADKKPVAAPVGKNCQQQAGGGTPAVDD